MTILFHRPPSPNIEQHVERIEEMILAKLEAGQYAAMQNLTVYYPTIRMSSREFNTLASYLGHHGYIVELDLCSISVVEVADTLVIRGITISGRL